MRNPNKLSGLPVSRGVWLRQGIGKNGSEVGENTNWYELHEIFSSKSFAGFAPYCFQKGIDQESTIIVIL